MRADELREEELAGGLSLDTIREFHLSRILFHGFRINSFTQSRSSINEACSIDVIHTTGILEEVKGMLQTHHLADPKCLDLVRHYLSGVTASNLLYLRCYLPTLCRLRFICTCGSFSPPSHFLNNCIIGLLVLKTP